MRLPGKKVIFALYDYVLYIASYLIFTTAYMGDNVNSCFTEDETRVQISGKLPESHPHSGCGVCIQALFQRH